MTRTSRTEPAEQRGAVSRRDFLHTAGSAAAGGLAVVATGSLFPGREARAADAPAAPPLPWTYARLDPLEAGRRGYGNYLVKGG